MGSRAEGTVGAVYDRPQCRKFNILGGHRPPLQANSAFLIRFRSLLARVRSCGDPAEAHRLRATLDLIAWRQHKMRHPPTKAPQTGGQKSFLAILSAPNNGCLQALILRCDFIRFKKQPLTKAVSE